MPIDEDKPLLANPDIVFREENEGSFLFDPNTGDLKCLNLMGSVIWKLCDGLLSIRQIEQRISERYPKIQQETIHKELSNFLKELFDMGYIGYQFP